MPKCNRPYYAENTGSHQNSEVKLHQASVVLRWGTTREVGVLIAFCSSCRHGQGAICFYTVLSMFCMACGAMLRGVCVSFLPGGGSSS